MNTKRILSNINSLKDYECLISYHQFLQSFKLHETDEQQKSDEDTEQTPQQHSGSQIHEVSPDDFDNFFMPSKSSNLDFSDSNSNAKSTVLQETTTLEAEQEHHRLSNIDNSNETQKQHRDLNQSKQIVPKFIRTSSCFHSMPISLKNVKEIMYEYFEGCRKNIVLTTNSIKFLFH